MPKSEIAPPPAPSPLPVRTFRIRIPFDLAEVRDVGGPNERSHRLGKGHFNLESHSVDSLDVLRGMADALKQLFGADEAVVSFE